MAGESGVPPGVIANWIEYGAAFVVAIIVGLTAKFGWNRARDVSPEKQVELVASVVDNRAVTTLIESIDHAVDRLIEIHEDAQRRDRRQVELISEIGADMRKLIRGLHDLIDNMKE